MSILKSKAYHSDEAISNVTAYSMDKEKTALENNILYNAVEYAANNLKTSYVADDGHTCILVSGHKCRPELAVETFKRTQDEYYRNGHNENVGRKYQVRTLLRAKLDKAGNPILDENGQFIHDEKSPVYHDPDTGDTISFMQTRYNRARTCYMLVQAFPPPSVCGFKIDEQLIHQIGKELMDEIEKEMGYEFPAIIATHRDKAHTHNHIVLSSYSFDGCHKYVDTMEMLTKIREINDRLSLKYDLPIILEPGAKHSLSHNEWKLAQMGKSWKQSIRDEIQYAVEHSVSYEEFLQRMKEAGYTYRETDKHLTWYTPGKAHKCRDVGLGPDYTKDSIMKHFSASLTPSLSKRVQRDSVEIIDPTQASQQKPLKIYVSRYTESGRRRTELEILLLKAIKILKHFRDKFSEQDASENPIRKSADWKVSRLSEAIAILDTFGVGTMKELDQKLLESGAKYSHIKKDFTDISYNREGLLKLKDSLENLKDLQTLMDDLGISDALLPPISEKEVLKNKANFFPMTSSQRRELFLALQEKPLYKVVSKYDSMTYDDARACINFLKGKSDILPPQLTTTLAPATDLEAKYLSIAEKSLIGLKERFGNQPVSEQLLKVLEPYNLPISLSNLSLSEAIHLAAYYKPWNPTFKPCKDESKLATSARIEQIRELLQYRSLSINISLEQLSKFDADLIFRDLTLRMITPDSVKEALDNEWNNILSHLSYENRGYAEEYRELVRTLESLGYDINNSDEILREINGQLQQIQDEEDRLAAAAQEYKTLKQLKTYTTLSSVKQFTHGPKWREQFDSDVFSEEIEQDSSPEEIKPSVGRRKFDTEIDFEY